MGVLYFPSYSGSTLSKEKNTCGRVDPSIVGYGSMVSCQIPLNPQNFL